VLWSASIVATRLLSSSRRASSRWISALLALHWIWSGLAFHLAFFTRINAAAWLFGALFIVEGALIFRVGVVQGRLSFAPGRSAWAPVAWALIAYSLVYPAINALQHSSISRIPAFGVPCPTTIYTAGVLMLAMPRWRRLAVIPVIWSVIGGSAASLFGVTADYALPISGIALAICFMTPRHDGAIPPDNDLRRSTAASAGHAMGESYTVLATVLLRSRAGQGSRAASGRHPLEMNHGSSFCIQDYRR
jgi:hypothetical protein